LARSFVSGNHAPAAAEAGNINGVFTVDGFNLFGYEGRAGVEGFGPGGSDVVPSLSLGQIIDPTLAAHGGPTWTHALSPGGPAIDAATSAGCAAEVDQRGEPRNRNGDGRPSEHECDIGSFEQQAPTQRVLMMGVVAR
jgi:hypothetical protein